MEDTEGHRLLLCLCHPGAATTLAAAATVLKIEVLAAAALALALALTLVLALALALAAAAASFSSPCRDQGECRYSHSQTPEFAVGSGQEQGRRKRGLSGKHPAC